MASKFRDWTREDALAKLKLQIEADLGSGEVASRKERERTAAVSDGMAAYEANRLIVEHGNYWQNGATWPVFYPDPYIRDREHEKIRPMFTPVPIISEAEQRQNNGLFGREATITVTTKKPEGEDGKPSKAQLERGDRGKAKLSSWWDSVGLWSQMRVTGRRAAWARRASARLRFLPSALRIVGRDRPRTVLAQNLPFEEAIAHITASAPLPHEALLYTDPETREKACIISFVDENGSDGAEVWFRDGDMTYRRILHADGVLPEGAASVNGAAVREIPMGKGALPLHEVTGELLVTDAVRRGQAQVNFISTRINRIIQAASHPATFATGAEPPVTWSPNPPDGKPIDTYTDDDGRKWYAHPVPFETGLELVNVLAGAVTKYDPATKAPLEVATPGITVIDPVDPAFLTNALAVLQANLLRSCKQGHAVNTDKDTSGESKRQDRADFAKQLESYRQSVEIALADILTAAGRNALLMTAPGDEMHGFFDDYSISCTLHIDTGPLTADEIRVEMELAEKNLKPRADVMASAGRIEDSKAADDAIAADPFQSLQLIEKRVEVFRKIRDSSNEAAAVLFLERGGLDADVIAAMGQNDIPTSLTQ